MNVLYFTKAIFRNGFRNMLFPALTFAVLVFWTAVPARAQLQVSSSLTAQELITQIFAGSTAVISNVTYKGAPGAIGSFTANATNLGLEAGILLTTGSVTNAIGPNIDTNRTTENGTAGDADLKRVYPDSISVQDAAVIEFDFYSYADRITFEYVFASEEYPEWTGSIYNDTFGFFISGPGYIGNENIALIPGTSTPVSINNINHIANSFLYVDNKNGQTLEYDGFTTVLTAEANVVPCATYHLKLAIGDVSDELYDSGVFLKAESFETGSSVYIAGIKNAIEGCGIGEVMLVRIGRTNHPISYSYQVGGTAAEDVDYKSLPGQVIFASEQDTAYVFIEAFGDLIADAGETVTITLKNNCGFVVDSASVTIGETEGFGVQIAGDSLGCFGEPIQLQAFLEGGTGPYNYYWEPPELFSSNMIHTPDSSMFYYLTVTDSSNGCQARDSFYVNVYYLQVEKSDDLFLCPSGKGTIGHEAKGGKPPFVYDWEPKKGLSSYTDPMPEAHPTETTEYILKVWDQIGCETTDTVLVHVSDLAIEIPGDDTLCAHGMKQIAALATGGSGEYKFRWSPALGVSDTTSDAPYLAPPFTTQYKVTLTDKVGCVVTDSFTLHMNSELVAAAGSDRNICPGSAVTLGRPAHGGTPPYTYLWEPPFDLEDPTAEMPTLIPATTRSYRVTVTDAFGCVAEDVVLVRVEPTVRADAGADTTVCRGARFRIRGSAAGGARPYTMRWTPGHGLSDSLSFQPYASPDSTTKYFLTVTDSIGCTFVDSVLVTVDELPDIRLYASGPAEFCAPDSVRLYSEPGYARYLWSNGDTTMTSVIHTSGTYGVSAWTAEGCLANSDSVLVKVNELPEIRVFGPVSVCLQSKSVYYHIPSPPGYTYTWSVSGGTIADQTANSISVLWNGTQQSMVSLTVTDPWSRCSMRIDYPVEVASQLVPVISYSGNAVRCLGDSVRLDAGRGYEEYLWSTGDTTVSIMVGASGSYSVTVIDSSGCAGTSAPVDLDFRAMNVPDVTVSGPVQLCDGDTATLSMPEGFASYVWSDGGTGRIRTITGPGEYSVTVTDSIGCSGTSNTVRIDGIALPSHSISGPTIACANVEADYFVDDIPGLIYQWNCAGGIIVTGAATAFVTVRWTAEGKGTLSLDVTKDGFTCAGLYTYDVDVVQNFEFDLIVEGDPVFCSDTGVVLRAPKGFQQYNWSNGEKSDSIYVRSSGVFWVTITDLEGCEGGSDTITTMALPSPAAVIEPMGPTDLCEGDSVVLQSQFVQQRYLWSNGETTRIITVTKPGTYTLTVTNAEGCSSISSPLAVNIADNPEPAISGPEGVCQNATERYFTPSNNSSTFIWTVNGGTVVSGGGTNAVDIRWNTAGPGNIEVLETTSGGCQGWAKSYSVTILPAPKPGIVRSGNTLSTDFQPAYQWNFNGAPIPGADGKTHEMTQPGSYTVTVLDDNGCKGTSDPIVYEPFAGSTISLPSLTALPGERVFVPVFVSEYTGFLDDAVETFSGAITFNASMLAPAGSTPAGTVDNGMRIVPLSGTKQPGNDTLAILEFSAMLGNASSASLTFESFAWDNPAVAVTTRIGTIEIVICREAGDRLFSDTGILQLSQNAPNPYNSSTVIEFHIIERGRTRLAVLDMLGREVAVIIDQPMQPGNYSAYFDANNLASGTYIYALTTPTARLHKTMRLMK